MNYSDQFNQLWKQAQHEIRIQIQKTGTESKFNSDTVLPVPEKYKGTISLGNGVLSEIGFNYLVNSEGNLFNYSVLDYDVFFEIVDQLLIDN
jgi:hypothetical protein